MAFSNDNLDVSLYFDLDNSRLRIQDNSDYTGATPAIALANVVGVYKLTDPNSNILHENADFDNPDVDLDVSLYSGYVTFTEVDGDYTLVYSVYDSDTATTYTKTFTYTYAESVIPTVVIDIESDVGLATISSTDETAFTVTKVLNTRTHTLTYPASWGSTTTTSIVVDAISLSELYTGEYSTTITSTITITGTDDLIILTSITGTETHDVWDTDGFYTVREALNTFYDDWQTNKTSNPKEGRRQATIWNEISANYAMYNSYKQNGDIENAGEYLNNIKTLLAAEDIDTDIDPSQSVPVTQVIPGYASQWLSGSGVPAASLGRTIDFYRDIDNNFLYSKATGSWVKDGEIGGYGYSVSPGTILIPKDEDGVYSYTNANAQIVIQTVGSDLTTDFTFSVSSVSNVDASVGASTGYVTIAELDTGSGSVSGSAVHAEGYVDIDCVKSGLDTVTIRIYVRDVIDGVSGISIYASPSSVSVTTDASGNNGVYPGTGGTDYPEVYVTLGNTNDTANWTFSIDTDTNITASVQNDNEIVLESMTADVASVIIKGVRSGFSDLYYTMYAFKAKQGSAIADADTLDTAYLLRGAALFITNRRYPTLTTLTTNEIASYDTDLNLLTTYTFDGSTWSVVGNEFTVPGGTVWGSIESMTATTVALCEPTMGEIRTYSWDGTDWTLDGNELAISGMSTRAALAKMSATRMAMIGDGNDELRVYDWDGSDWTYLAGSALSIASNTLADITALSSTRIAYIDTGNIELRTYDFDGSNFSLTGSGLPIAAGFNSISVFNSTTVCVINDDTGTISFYRLTGSTWALYGDVLNIDHTVNHGNAITIMNKHIVYTEETTESLYAYIRTLIV